MYTAYLKFRHTAVREDELSRHFFKRSGLTPRCHPNIIIRWMHVVRIRPCFIQRREELITGEDVI